MFIMGLLNSMTLISQPLATTYSANVINNISNINERIDLGEIYNDTSDFIVDKYNKDGSFNTQDLTKEVSLNAYNKNREIKGMKEFFNSFVRNTRDWEVIGLPNSLPTQSNQKVETTIAFVPMIESLNFDNSLLLNVNFCRTNGEEGCSKTKPETNTEEKAKLKDILKNTHIGTIKNPSEKLVLTNDVKLNNDLVVNDLNIDSISYKEEMISSKTYDGSVLVDFDSKFVSEQNENNSFRTQKAQVEAYNSEQSMTKSASLDFNIALGKDALAGSFDYIGINWKGYSWNNQDSERWHNNDHFSGTTDNIEFTTKKIGVRGTNDTTVFDRIYSNTNWMKCFGYISISWTDDFTLSINCWVEVSSYATAWNAYWAKAAAYIEIDNVLFI